MSDYGTMKSRIADELARADLSTQIPKAIQDAIKLYERKQFYFNSKVNGTFSTVASQEYYGNAANTDIPNLSEISSMKGTLNGVTLPIIPQAFETIDQAQNGNVVGFPEFFAYFAQQVRLYPMPSEVWTITGAWTYRLPTLSADADTNAWMTDAEELIRRRAKINLMVDVIRTVSSEEIERQGVLLRDCLSGIETETRKRRSNNRLNVDPMLVGNRGRYNIRYQ